jgi:hypothetical protein
MTPQQTIAANPIVYFDLRGVIDAGQQELCPDTIRWKASRIVLVHV